MSRAFGNRSCPELSSTWLRSVARLLRASGKGEGPFDPPLNADFADVGPRGAAYSQPPQMVGHLCIPQSALLYLRLAAKQVKVLVISYRQVRPGGIPFLLDCTRENRCFVRTNWRSAHAWPTLRFWAAAIRFVGLISCQVSGAGCWVPGDRCQVSTNDSLP